MATTIDPAYVTPVKAKQQSPVRINMPASLTAASKAGLVDNTRMHAFTQTFVSPHVEVRGAFFFQSRNRHSTDSRTLPRPAAAVCRRNVCGI